MGMSATELLDLLDYSGTPDAVIDSGRQWVAFGGKEAEELVGVLEKSSATKGTIDKAHRFLKGELKKEAFDLPPPKNGAHALERRVVEEAKEISTGLATQFAREMGEQNERLLRRLQEEMPRKADEHAQRQAEGLAAAEARGIGAPQAARPAGAQAAKK